MGAARFLRGLARVVEPKRLSVIVNTGDDDVFYGLHVSPDVDTIVYTLAGLAPLARGWGLAGDTHRVEGALERFYGKAWFRLGDRDLATNLYRSDLLQRGRSLSQCTREICRRLGVAQTVLPATDDSLRTTVDTASGALAFQNYLVRRRARPAVRKIRYLGARRARPAPGVVEAIESADLLLIAPSNPLVSIRPILAVAEVGRAVARARGRCTAVSPLIGGRAVKGPLDRMLRQLGGKTGTAAIADFYRRYAEALVVSPGDGAGAAGGKPRILEHPTLIKRPSAAAQLAGFVLDDARARARRDARRRPVGNGR